MTIFDELLKTVNAKAPEASYVEKIASAQEPVAPVVDEDAEFKKLAEQTEALARIGVRAQYDEWMKIAQEAGVDPATLVQNPAVQVANTPQAVENASQAAGIVRQLTNGAEQAGPVGTVNVNNAPVGAAKPQAVVDEAPIAHDAQKVAAVTDSLKIALYNEIFGK